MLLGESLNGVQLVGVAVVFGGVVLSQDWKDRKTDTPDEAVEGVLGDAAAMQPAMAPLGREE
jgi:hypothetical protein